mmetsp:Transcript_11093/g.16157  ORF Transcript_11093/g.16157 Transcript_11093/m.16157 type:complete len:93 (-) Transcript_11093:299-577(-)
MVSPPNAISDPWTVMVKFRYADVATVAVFGARGAEYVAGVTISISEWSSYGYSCVDCLLYPAIGIVMFTTVGVGLGNRYGYGGIRYRCLNGR